MNATATRSSAVRRDASRVQFPTLVVLLIVVSVGSSFAGQESTLNSKKDVARRNGGMATDKIDVEPPSMSLSELVSQSDLIIRGRLETVTARLSDDESTVFRDFAVTPIVIIKQSRGLAQASKPGPLPALTLRQIGGRLVVDGLTLVTTTNFEDPDSPMAPGQEYVLFLSTASPSPSTTMSTPASVFRLTSVAWGAYPIRNNTVGSFTKWQARRPDRTPDDAATLIAQIRDLVGSSKD